MADTGPAGSEGNNPVLYVDSDVGLDVASALIPGVTAPMTKVAVKRKVDRTLVNNRKHKQIIELYD